MVFIEVFPPVRLTGIGIATSTGSGAVARAGGSSLTRLAHRGPHTVILA